METSSYGWWWRRALLGGAALAIGFAALVMLWLLARPLALLFAAIVIANALAPLVERLERRIRRGFAVAVVYVVFVLVVVGIVTVITTPLIEQARESITSIPSVVESIQRRINAANLPAQDRLLSGLTSATRGLSGTLLRLPLLVVSSLLEIALVVVMSAYWVAAMPRMHAFALSLFPARQQERVATVVEGMGQAMGGYVRGTAIDGAILGVLAYVGYLLIGVQSPLLLGLLAGMAAFVPLVGAFLAAIPAVVLALADSPIKALVVVGFYLLLQQIEGNFLLPNILGRQADIPPLLTLVALLGGASIGGMLGALVAIPLSAALLVFVTQVVVPAVRSWTGAEPDGDTGSQHADREAAGAR